MLFIRENTFWSARIENSYLICAPFPKPADKENHLADMVYYSKQFMQIESLCYVPICISLKNTKTNYLSLQSLESNDRIEGLLLE